MAIVPPEEAREEANAALSAAVGAKDLEGLKAAIEAAEAAGVAKKSLQQARKAAEKLQQEEEKEEEAPANKADDEDALADAIVAAAMLESWPGSDEPDSGSAQGEPSGSDEDAAFLVPAASAGASGHESDGEAAYLAVCALCCATRLLDLDVMGLGIDFDCCMVGEACEGSETAAAGACTAAPAGGGDADAKTHVLTAEERQAIFAKYGRGIEASGNKAAAPLVPVREMPKIRFRDNQIVTHKGERIIKEDRSSKKERAHVKGRESYVCETKTSMS